MLTFDLNVHLFKMCPAVDLIRWCVIALNTLKILFVIMGRRNMSYKTCILRCCIITLMAFKGFLLIMDRIDMSLKMAAVSCSITTLTTLKLFLSGVKWYYMVFESTNVRCSIITSKNGCTTVSMEETWLLMNLQRC